MAVILSRPQRVNKYPYPHMASQVLNMLTHLNRPSLEITYVHMDAINANGSIPELATWDLVMLQAHMS